MNGTDWPGESLDEWPEAFGFGDIAKGVLMPHTIPLSIGKRIIDSRGGRGGKVVQHTQPPPIAQNAREVQGQFTGLLKTVKGVEEKLDDNTRQLALLQKASAGSNEALIFRQSLAALALGVKIPGQDFDPLRLVGHLVPFLQNISGAMASFSTKPVSTIAIPLAAALIANAKEIAASVRRRRDEDEDKPPKWVDYLIDSLNKSKKVGVG